MAEGAGLLGLGGVQGLGAFVWPGATPVALPLPPRVLGPPPARSSLLLELNLRRHEVGHLANHGTIGHTAEQWWIRKDENTQHH